MSPGTALLYAHLTSFVIKHKELKADMKNIKLLYHKLQPLNQLKLVSGCCHRQSLYFSTAVASC